MIRVTSVYKNTPDARFDFDYFANVHMPLVKKHLTAFGMGEFVIEKGVEAVSGGTAPYLAIMHMEISTKDGLMRGLAKHSEELFADIPKYTNIEPEMQISEIIT